ncbi:YgiQ family radical SAM protein [Desulfovibrio sp. DS-1]|nr:YgiQ family radical SAM protein [Nitratidesulfovibrio sp. SRB-5]RXF76712.1 YgiQ family radical SAM protein [Desulfovibrio sp. DS-1]
MPRHAAPSGACPRAYIPQRGRTPLPQPAFLPTTAREMRDLGWDRLDVLLVSGDAYVDHPTFAMALLGRWLVAHGFRTGIVAQPRWDIPDDVARMGRPRLFTGISAGSLDSMLAHYTAFRKKRHDDAFTPGGHAGARPNRAAIVYANLARQAFPGLPVVLGGIEASLRRISHYDFWTDALRRPILMDAKADLLVWGMGERALLDATCALDAAVETVGADAYDAALLPPLAEIFDGIPGTARMGRVTEWDAAPADDAARGAGDTPDTDDLSNDGQDEGHTAPRAIPAIPPISLMRLPSHAAIMADPRLLMRATLLLERHVHRGDARAIQPVDDTPTARAVLLAPPAPPLSPDEMDALYALPFARRAHPSHREPVPAEEMIRTSITTHRGCGGGCSFCSLALHQGRRIASRSRDSVLDEARRLNDMERFNGSVSDVGGPSANMWQARCTLDPARCRRASCMHPRVCPGFAVDQSEAVELLRAVRATPGVRHVRVASGVRFDLALRDADALRAYTMEFTGGQLKVAPEHICDGVLDLMRKPGLAVFERFLAAFADHSTAAGKEQYVVPYLLSAFPGCTDDDMRTLSRWLAARGWSPRQVQCFIPTPGTVATAMFFAGIDPEGNPVPVARTDATRLRQHRILIPDFGLPPAAGGRAPGAPGNRPGGKSGSRPNERSGGQDHRSHQGRGDRQERGSEADRDRRGHGERSGGRPDGRPGGTPGGPGNGDRNANRNETRNDKRPDSRPGSRPGSHNDRRGGKGGGGRSR